MLVGIDTGGTFTDGVVYDPQTGDVRIAKVLSSPEAPSRAFLEAVDGLEAPVAALRAVVHGTTIATNAVIQRRGAACGLITTRGFRDVLELRRRDRPKLYGLDGTFEPLIPRDRRLEVAERTDAQGRILEPVDEDEVREAAERLREMGVEVLVIAFLHAYANPENEQRAREAAAAVWPTDYVVTAHEVLPQFREFERTSTATLNGYVQPLVADYLADTSQSLDDRGFDGDFTVIQSNGGSISYDLAGRLGVHLIMSGPAAGVIAASQTAAASGVENIVSFDMGGTSSDLCLVREGEPATTSTTVLEFGLPMAVPMLDIATLGAGGGSIAFVDKSGILEVGPQSAGSVPGPACHGRGGTEPTVTDANVVLGRIDGAANLGGRGQLQLDVSLAEAAIRDKVATPLGMELLEAADAIIAVANAKMASSIRLVSVGRGQDPREYSLVAYGGAGPLHASALMREVGFEQALIPLFPGVTSALGCILSRLRSDLVTSVHRDLEAVEPAAIEEIRREQDREGRAWLAAQGIDEDGATVEQWAEVCYVWQTSTVSVPLGDGAGDPAAILAGFAARYTELYGGVLQETPVELVALRTTVRGLRDPVDLARLAGNVLQQESAEPIGRRPVHFGGAPVDATVYDRMALPLGFRSRGPAVLEQQDSTILVAPEDNFEVDAVGNVVIADAGEV